MIKYILLMYILLQISPAITTTVGQPNSKQYQYETLPYVNLTGDPVPVEQDYYEVTATVTAYNTVRAQTDDSPCIASRNTYVCGRSDVVACPSTIPYGTHVTILGRDYMCVDRTARKYDGRFDISFDKDIEGAKQFGKQILTVRVYE